MRKTIILVCLIALVLAFTGCTQSQPEQKAEKNATTEVSSEETIQQILAKAKEPKNMECEVVMATDGTPVNFTMKVYLKGEKYLTELKTGEATLTQIFDGENVYTYSPAESEFYCKSDLSTLGLPSDILSFEIIAEKALADPNIKELGKETIDGIKVRVIEFSYEDYKKHKVKAWVSEEHGIVVKREVEENYLDTEIKIMHSTELKNIKFNSVQDSVFEVPTEKIKPLEDCLG